MIKVESIGYQGDSTVLSVRYDLDGEEYTATIKKKISLVAKMTLDEIYTYIYEWVEVKRDNALRTVVDSKLNQLLTIDVEEKAMIVQAKLLQEEN